MKEQIRVKFEMFLGVLVQYVDRQRTFVNRIIEFMIPFLDKVRNYEIVKNASARWTE
jgi:hypothetical protein